MNEPREASTCMPDLGWIDDAIESAPEAPETGLRPAGDSGRIELATGVPKRYRASWERPQDPEWLGLFSKLSSGVDKGGTLALIGERGTGKTRLAAEIVRSHARTDASYMTAMDFFVRLKGSYRKDSKEDESQVLSELSRCRLLVLDELQERSNSEWEDRLLVNVIDKRYGALLPTILIANLTPENLVEALGPSITDRMRESGGILKVTGKSFRQ